jgi:hypothetical protein
MREGIIRKGLVIGIIVLFVGTSIIPGLNRISNVSATNENTALNKDKSFFPLDTPSWQWAVHGGGGNYDRGWSICVDSSGNNYVTGYFLDTAWFGSITLTSSGEEDVFVAKLNIDGVWQWAVSAGGTFWDCGDGICVDLSGNIYVTGGFDGTATFGSTTLTSSGMSDVFVAKLNTNGIWQWAVNGGGGAGDSGTSICVDTSGNTYTTGFFSSHPATFGSTMLTCEGAGDVYVAKLNSDGDWQWAVSGGGGHNDVSNGICVDPNGYIYVTGKFNDTVMFGSTMLIDNGYNDVFLAKLNNSGGWQWAVRGGGMYGDEAWSISVDSNGNSYITGQFILWASFGGIFLISNGDDDCFVAKIDTNSNWLWAKNAGGNDLDAGIGICLDSSSNVYITGAFWGTAWFGSTTLDGHGFSDVFVAKMNTNGDWQWAVQAGGTDYDVSCGIYVNPIGNLSVTGYFLGVATFGSTTLISSGYMDVFVAKLSTVVGENQPPVANFTWTPQNPIPNQQITFDASASYDPDGTIVLYEWDWNNDGVFDESHTTSMATHSWANVGNYPVTLRVTDDDDATDTETKTVNIGSGNQPDLIVQDMTLPNYMVENQRYTIRAGIKNIGTANAEYNFKIQFLEWAPSATDWTILDTQNIYSLYPGQYITRDVSWVSDEPGTYLFKVIADVNDDVAENNEFNNQKETSGFVRPKITTFPSVKYTSGLEIVNIDAKFYDNILKMYIKTGSAAWKIYDQAGSLCLLGTLIFDTPADQWQAHNIDVNSLTTGELYTVKISYGSYTLSEKVDFRKTSGYCIIEGYVKDRRTNNPIADVTIRLYDPWWHYFVGLPPVKTVSTDDTGYYTLGPVDVHSGWPNIISTTASGYLSQIRGVYPQSDQVYQVDFRITDTNGIQFENLLAPLNSSIHGTMDGTVTKIVSMNHDLYDILHPDADEGFLWDVLDVAGSVMVGGSKNFAGLSEKFASPGFKAALQENLEKAITEEIGKKIPERVIQMIGKMVLQDIIEYYAQHRIDALWVTSQQGYDVSSNLVTTLHDEFQTAAEGKTIPDSFDFSTADSAILSISDQLSTIYGRDLILIPFDISNPRTILFPNALEGFLNAKTHYEYVSNTGKVLVIGQLICGIVAVALIATGVGAPAGVVLLGTGVGLSGTAVGFYEEIGAKPAGFFTCGTALGRWCEDLRIYPSIIYDAKDFFLAEVDNPYYLNINNHFDSSVNVVGFPDIVHAPWNGKIINGLFDVTINNTGNVKSDIFVNIDGIWTTLKDVPGNNGIRTIPDIDYLVRPYGPQELLIGRDLKVEAYSGVSIYPKESHTIHYYIQPGSTSKADEYLPMSSTSKRLTLADYEKSLPSDSVIIDSYLSIDNPLLETNYTVNTSARSVDFYLFSPSKTPVKLSVFDQQENHIGYNLSTGCADVQFIGSYNGIENNPQIISIPDAAGKTFRVQVRLDMMYSTDDKYHVTVDAFETPYRPVILSVSPEEIMLPAATGSNISVPVLFGEAGLYEPLFNVTVSISDIQNGQLNLSLFSDPVVDVGVILPGTGTYASFVLGIPQNAAEGEYTGIITVNASNAESIPVTVRILVSNPPEQPNLPFGPCCGVKEKNYTFTTSTVDPEAGQVYYQWNWDDGNISDWIGPFNSGATVSVSHMWQDEGTYNVKVLAKDTYGIISNWSEPLVVDIINASLLKRTWLFGLISNVNTGDELTCFNASILLAIRLAPPSLALYTSSEKLVASNDYLGKILPHFILGRFNTLVVSESSSSTVHPFRARLKQLIVPQT